MNVYQPISLSHFHKYFISFYEWNHNFLKGSNNVKLIYLSRFLEYEKQGMTKISINLNSQSPWNKSTFVLVWNEIMLSWSKVDLLLQNKLFHKWSLCTHCTSINCSVTPFRNWFRHLRQNASPISSYFVQLNEYETAPYILQLSQNVTTDCLLILMFLILPSSYLFLHVLNLD